MKPTPLRAQAMIAAIAAIFILAVAAPALAQSVDQVTAVTTPTGMFVQLQNGRWEERGADGARFNFQETNRDDASIYLFDASRQVQLQLNIATRTILYADPTNPQMRPIYQISNLSIVVNGRNASRVSYAQGAFRMVAPGQWVEKGNNGAVFNFTESNRDDWSVYLVDGSRGLEIQLDLFTRKIMYSQPGQPRSPLYEVTGASARYQ